MRNKGLVETAERRGSEESSVFSLSVAQPGDRLEIVALNGQDASARLLGMGFIPGTVLNVVIRMLKDRSL